MLECGPLQHHADDAQLYRLLVSSSQSDRGVARVFARLELPQSDC